MPRCVVVDGRAETGPRPPRTSLVWCCKSPAGCCRVLPCCCQRPLGKWSTQSLMRNPSLLGAQREEERQPQMVFDRWLEQEGVKVVPKWSDILGNSNRPASNSDSKPAVKETRSTAQKGTTKPNETSSCQSTATPCLHMMQEWRPSPDR